jgi:HD-GYP domain-containing protein (c-di-GMP phosphodiesterase class II)
MQYSPLATVKHRIQIGSPIPFNIRNADKTLLLARGKVIETEEQLEALFERGALVDSEELKSVRQLIAEARPEHLPLLWGKSIDRVGRTLRASITPEGTDFSRQLDEAAKPVLALVERDPDLAIFQVVRQDVKEPNAYGVSHSVHSAIASYLVARRLGWEATQVEKVFKAALTMNLAMLELQTRLASQVTPLTAQQREAIHCHPVRSAEMLVASGINDAEWIEAVVQHHESPDGSGYPNKHTDISDMALLLRQVDIYTAKLSARVTRQPLPANKAGRDLFMADKGSAMTAAIIKEFGVYPPGCFVAMASGEVGVVISRGSLANSPLVAALTNRKGEPLIEPVRRDTSQKEHAITAVVSESSLRVRVSPEKLVVLAQG